MPRALRVCPTPGCSELTAGGRCTGCKARAERQRGTAAQRGYNSGHWRVQRRACLRRDPICTCVDRGCGHGSACLAPSTVADHDPHERKDLLAQGVADPDALCYLKGKCKRCHDRKTAGTRAGGWAAR